MPITKREKEEDDSNNIEDALEDFLIFVKEKLYISKDNASLPKSSKEPNAGRPLTCFLDFVGIGNKSPVASKGHVKKIPTNKTKQNFFQDMLDDILSKTDQSRSARRSTVELRANLVEHYRKKYSL